MKRCIGQERTGVKYGEDEDDQVQEEGGKKKENKVVMEAKRDRKGEGDGILTLQIQKWGTGSTCGEESEKGDRCRGQERECLEMIGREG